MKFLTLISLLLGLSISGFSFNKKEIINEWKMVLTQKEGKEIKPEHQHLVINLKKNGTYIITASLEETHYGDYSISENIITLHDDRLDENLVIEIIKAEKSYLIIKNYDLSGTELHFKPVKSKKAYKLSHKEHMLCHKWVMTSSSKTDMEGTIFEFHENKEFIIILENHRLPDFVGEWKMSKDHKTLILDTSDHKTHMELQISELHRHKLVLDNLETNEHNVFKDLH